MTEPKPRGFLRAAACLAALLLSVPALVANAAEEHGATGVDWQAWTANNQVWNTESLQRGATNFVNYCLGCHSLKYMRYSRMGVDLGIPEARLQDTLIPTNAKPTDYMLSTFPAVEGETWFGKAPPDLSLTARAKGTNYIYQFLKGFYVDASKATGTNNLALDGAAMPAVLSDLEGVKAAVFGEADEAGVRHVERFDQVAAGRMTPEQFDSFVRDTVNFLDYASEPTQVQRRALGIWVVLFLAVFTLFAWLLKREYWKDVH
ncbi:MAG: cytochrome c1 [Nevskiaceae bacterium]|jgi:ubiquinol-cytochrome c reductase cytochrome c1 subunit|nr:cytochrome c1 [Nevskiaceae bacterium]